MEKSQAENATFLNNPDKWEDWELQFKAQAVSYSLDAQIFENEAFQIKPTEPVRPSYRSTPQTRSQSAQSSVTASSEPEANISSITGLNAELQTNYLEDIKAYNQEIENIRGLQNWIKKTVCSAYQ